MLSQLCSIFLLFPIYFWGIHKRRGAVGKGGGWLAVNGDRFPNLLAIDILPGCFLAEVWFKLTWRGEIKLSSVLFTACCWKLTFPWGLTGRKGKTEQQSFLLPFLLCLRQYYTLSSRVLLGWRQWAENWDHICAPSSEEGVVSVTRVSIRVLCF